MLALPPPSPLGNANRDFEQENINNDGRTSAPPCFMSLLADAALMSAEALAKKPRLVAPASLECSEIALSVGPNGTIAPPLETSVRPRCPSRPPRPNSATGNDAESGSSSRATSPAVSGRAYLCKRCGREYASTDAVRKHARQNHGDWLREMGQGSPLLYCTPVDNAQNVPAGPVAAALAPGSDGPAAVSLSTVVNKGRVIADLATPPPLATFTTFQHSAAPAAAAPTIAAPTSRPAFSFTFAPAAESPAAPSEANSQLVAPSTPLSPGSSSLLMTAAESCLALSMAAGRGHGNAYADDDDEHSYPAFLQGTSKWPVQAAKAPKQPGAMKRPRSVRCGKCDGCEREDCGTCKNCVDKPKFGGIGQRKQGCIRKLCREPRVAV